MVHKTDYDSTDIPVGYDRGRDHGPEFLDLWMNVVSSHVGKQRLNTILDLGCGTGRFSEGLAAHFERTLSALTPQRRCWRGRAQSFVAAGLDTRSGGAKRYLFRMILLI